MAGIRVRKRKRMREKEIKDLKGRLEDLFGVKVFTEKNVVDFAEGSYFDFVFVDNEVLGMIYEGKPFLTVRGLLKYKPESYAVTVDMGAVPYVVNGADVMGPGIVDADPRIEEGNMVWIRDVRNRAPLAVGIAMRDSSSMISREKGKAIRILHTVSDRLWKLDE
ncbi:MAG: RNA-binding protein [archaeon]|nr:RNA-binding protein [archaeon]